MRRLISVTRKVIRGYPYLMKEVRSQVSDCTPFFVARPRVVHLWRNKSCNGRCIMCGFGYLDMKKNPEQFNEPLADAHMEKLLHEIHAVGRKGTVVSYMAGEPLLSRSLPDWVITANKLGLDFRFTTNGYLLDDEMARKLIAGNLFNIGVSLESLDPDINEIIRPIPKGTEKTIRGIEALLRERKRQSGRTSINIKCTMTQVNMHAITDILGHYGKKEGVIITPQMFEASEDMPDEIKNKLWIRDIQGLGDVLTKIRQMRQQGYHLNADDNALKNFLKKYRDDPDCKATMQTNTVQDENAPACNIGTDNLFINGHGDLKLCPNFPSIGNWLKDNKSIEDLWHGEQARKTRKAISRCRRVCTMSCLRRTSLLHKAKIFMKMQ